MRQNLTRAFGLALATAMAVGPAAPVFAQAEAPPVTVTTLLGLGYSVVSSFMTPIGPALFLQRGDADSRPVTLYFCVLEETPDNGPLTTQYCKRVE